LGVEQGARMEHYYKQTKNVEKKSNATRRKKGQIEGGGNAKRIMGKKEFFQGRGRSYSQNTSHGQGAKSNTKGRGEGPVKKTCIRWNSKNATQNHSGRQCFVNSSAKIRKKGGG